MTIQTDKQLLTLLKRAARKKGTESQGAKSRGTKSISAAQFEHATGLHASVIKKRFGTWNNAVRKAGLKANEARRHQYDDPLVEIYRRCCTRPKCAKQKGKRGSKVSKKGHEVSGRASRKRSGPASASPLRTLGARIGGRIVLFEPRYESGVVLLFGVLAERLGFRVLQVRKDYPDMFAWRRLPGTDKWEQVRCEFEVKSRDFRLHGHDSEQCDLIICWKHNWPACPLEVLELKSVLSLSAVHDHENTQGERGRGEK